MTAFKLLLKSQIVANLLATKFILISWYRYELGLIGNACKKSNTVCTTLRTPSIPGEAGAIYHHLLGLYHYNRM